MENNKNYEICKCKYDGFFFKKGDYYLIRYDIQKDGRLVYLEDDESNIFSVKESSFGDLFEFVGSEEAEYIKKLKQINRDNIVRIRVQERELRDTRAKYKELDNNYTNLTMKAAQMKEFQNMVKEEAKNYNTSTELEEAQKRIEEIKNKYHRVLSDLEKVTNDKNTINDQNEVLLKENENIKQSYYVEKARKANLLKEYNEVINELRKVKKSRLNLKEENAKLKEKLKSDIESAEAWYKDTFNTLAAETKTKVTELREESKNKSFLIDQYEKELLNKNNEIKNLKDQLEKQKTANEVIDQESKDLNRNVEQLKKDLESEKNAKKQLKILNDDLIKENAKLENKNRKYTSKESDYIKAITDFQKIRDTINEMLNKYR